MVEIYERGQIVIPKYIRDMLKLTPGTNLNATVEEGKIVLERYDPAEELENIRADNAVYATKELARLTKKIDRKRHEELMRDVY
jgi:AbrB family looped-hinge helix DNA binding protein